MTTAYRFPVLVWEDHSGSFTASLVEDPEATVGLGATASEAVSQLKEYLDWAYQKYPWRPAPDFLDPKLINIRVEVRPEYQHSERVFPCEELLVVRVACVHGRSSHGLLSCSLPMLGIRFLYNEPGKLKDLVIHYAQDKLRGLTPREAARYLQPRQAFLEEITLHINSRESSHSYTSSIETLDRIAEPLGDKRLRRQFSRAWQREAEVEDLLKRISQEKASVLIVGESGAGKTSVLIEAVRQIEKQAEQDQGEDSGDVKGTRFKHWLTSGARLISGMQYLGEWQARCEKVVEELSDINGVLCLDNLLDLIRTGGSADESLAAFLTPYLQRGELRIVAEATPSELDACRRLAPGLVDLFQILFLRPFNREEALVILNRIAANHSRSYKVEIAAEVPARIYRLFHRFLPYQAFPGRSVAFFNELAEAAARRRAVALDANDVIAHFVRQTGLPEIFLRDETPLDFQEVRETFRRKIIGQEAPCEAATHLVTTFKAGMNDPNRPLGVLLFCGPTGVGKTELARAIAGYFFGHGEKANLNERLMRLDLSEYAGWGAAQRLLIGPDGEPSELIKRVRRQPFCVVLLDEIEKADADVFDVLLSVFDEGRLTDRYGRVTTFRSAVIIMTTNLGADKLETLGFESKGAPSYSREAMNFFRPEFFNRIDAVVQFNPLSQEMMRQITAKELSEIAAREGLLKNNLRLAWSDELAERLISTGFDPRYGARPLQQAIETSVVAPLARYLLDHPEIKNATLRLTFDEEKKLRCEESNDETNEK